MNWDYIIVGAGSAGCALASELAHCARKKTILVLEAGGSDRSPFIRFPAGAKLTYSKYDWGYQSQPDPSRHGAREAWTLGRVLGGSSSINGTMYVRGAAEDFDRWAAQYAGSTAAGWSAAEVLPIFRALERRDPDGAVREARGALHVRTIRRPHAITQAFIQSAGAAGYAFNADYNGPAQEGIAYAQVSQRHGWRCSAADAFLRPLLRQKNLTLLLNAGVERIEVAQGRAVAVCFVQGRQRRREMAREIILCAGAINTPKLLMLSGIGDPEELRRHHIDVVVDLPGVGRNLQEHPLIRFLYRTRIPTYNLTEGLWQKVRIAAQFLARREGPISNIFEATAFLKSSPGEPAPDIQLHFLPIGFVKMSTGGVEFTRYPAAMVFLNKSYPRSRGRIRLASRNAADAPLIECRLLAEEADVTTLVQGVHTVRNIMATEPMASLIAAEVAPGPDVEGDSALADYVRHHTGITNHPAGTCRMGTDAEAVVTPELRVRGVDNLWIADASVMPDLISGNTNAACMMIGMKLGKHLVARHRSLEG